MIMTMVESLDDITRQARQGSVAAIIQILNDRLVDSGVRTRAVLVQGILQLLCEAATPDRLEQKPLVSRIRHILESLQPRHIRRVRINSRLVNEQQLLWLDEIKKDPEGQLLWAEDITLRAPNPIKTLIEDISATRHQRDRIPKASSASRKGRDRHQFWLGIAGGAGLSVAVLLLGWATYDWMMASRLQGQDRFPETGATAQESPDAQTPTSTAQPVSDSSEVEEDAFAQAVMLAEEAVADGQNAETPAEWLELASRWQRASDLMGEISPDDSRYPTAQNRKEMYRQNREQALNQATLLQEESQREESSE